MSYLVDQKYYQLVFRLSPLLFSKSKNFSSDKFFHANLHTCKTSGVVVDDKFKHFDI